MQAQTLLPSDRIDADDILYCTRIVEAAQRGGEFGWCDPEVDRLIIDAFRHYDPERIMSVLICQLNAVLNFTGHGPSIIKTGNEFYEQNRPVPDPDEDWSLLND
jgi:hypothetical protein